MVRCDAASGPKVESHRKRAEPSAAPHSATQVSWRRCDARRSALKCRLSAAARVPPNRRLPVGQRPAPYSGVESTPDFEAVAGLVAEHRGAGRVIGAMPRSSTASDVVLTTIRRSSDGFAVRHVVIDLDGLIASRDGLFDGEPLPDPPYRYTEQSLLDLDAAVQVAAARSTQSWSTPIPALAGWKALGGPFEEQFEWTTLRQHVQGLPRRPLWQRAVRSALGWAGAAVTAVLAILAAGDQVSGYDDDASLTDLLSFGAVAFAALGAAILVVVATLRALEWYQRRRPASARRSRGRHSAT